MTKTQAKKKLEQAIDILQDLLLESEETRDEIEPYENKDELTPQQEERYEWFDELVNGLETIIDELNELDY